MAKTTLIIFGATGDLMTRKIAPSLYHLYGQEQLDPEFSIVGFGRREFSHDDFRKFLLAAFYSKNSLQALSPRLQKFLELFQYTKGQFDNLEDYKKLAQTIPGNKLFYLAVPPEHYETIFKNIAESGLSSETENSWSRVLVEKPFGNNLKDAEKLDELLNSLFSEKQVY